MLLLLRCDVSSEVAKQWRQVLLSICCLSLRPLSEVQAGHVQRDNMNPSCYACSRQ